MDNNYEALIKKIKKRRNIVTVLSVVAIILTVFHFSPLEFEFLGEVIVDYEGNFIAMTAIIVLILLICLFAGAIAVNPMTASMITECDPEKHLILNTELNKAKSLDEVFVMDNFYLGNFSVALDFANKIASSTKPRSKCIGIFNKARCEFFLNDFNSLKSTTEQYRLAISKMKTSQKDMQAFIKMQEVLELLVAISDKDEQKIIALKSLKPWNNAKPTDGFVNYVQGLAAMTINDKEEAIYRFKSASEICKKTVLFELSNENLSKLRIS